MTKERWWTSSNVSLCLGFTKWAKLDLFLSFPMTQQNRTKENEQGQE